MFSCIGRAESSTCTNVHFFSLHSDAILKSQLYCDDLSLSVTKILLIFLFYSVSFQEELEKIEANQRQQYKKPVSKEKKDDDIPFYVAEDDTDITSETVL